MICDDCVFLEKIGEKGVARFWNKCALSDIYNLETGDKCEHYEALTTEDDAEERIFAEEENAKKKNGTPVFI